MKQLGHSESLLGPRTEERKEARPGWGEFWPTAIFQGLSLLGTYQTQYLGLVEHSPQRHNSHGHKHSSAALDWHSLVAVAAGLLQ
jgi:hypothetical protein